MTDTQHDFLDGIDDDTLLLTALLAPLDSSDVALALPLDDAVQTLPAPLMERPNDSFVPAAAGMSPSTAIHLDATHNTLDEALLLAETEALLTILEPVPASAMGPSSSVTPVIKTENIASFIVGDLHNSTHSLALKSTSSTEHTLTHAAKTECTSQRGRKRGSKPGSMRNPSRERLQNELEYLRKQVVVLEHELEQKQANASPSASPGSDNGTPEPAMTVVSNWERIAKRQRTNCERAVSENKRLRSMLALQKELVAGMEATLYNWQHVAQQTELLTAASSSDSTSPNWADPSVGKTVHLEPGDDLLFELLVSELDATYAHVDEMFRDAGLDALGAESLLRTTAKTQSTRDGSLRSFFEVIEVDVSPFDFELTNRVARICSERQSQQRDCVSFDGGWSADGVVTEKYRVKRVLNGEDVYFHMLMALKEHAFDDRFVGVWRCMFRCDAHFPDTYVQETGAFMATPLDTGGSTGGTLYKMCAHLEPKRFASSTTTAAAQAVVHVEEDVMTTLVMDAYHDDMQEMNDMMESMLLEESRKRA